MSEEATLHEDLSNTFEEMLNPEAPEKKKEEEEKDALREEEKEGEGEEEITEKEIDESTSEEADEEPSKDDEDSEEEDEEESEETAAWKAGSLEPNSGWDKETQEGFKQLPENMQEFMLKRYQDMQSDYTTKTKDVADIKRALDPVREEIGKLDLSDGAAIRNLVGAHLMLKNNPNVGIQYLMTAYGLTLEDVQENWQEPQEFSRKLKENSRLSRIEGELDAKNQDAHKVAYDEQMVEIEAFKTSHPHFGAAEKIMTDLAKFALMAGEPKPSLESLYEKAMNHPDMLALKSESDKPKSGDEVKQAKKASTRLKATPKKKAKEPEKPQSLHDDLSSEWDKGINA